jgi:predicted dehydrogenase
MEKDVTRRDFLASTGAGIGAGAIASLGAPAIGRALGTANDRIVLGLIGCGGQGRHDMNCFMGLPEVEVAAVCDVDEGHLGEAARQVEKKYGTPPKTFKDFRKLLEMKDVHAVIVGTPDHWHALPTIAACEAGKDVYVEKPLSHDIAESRAMVSAAKRFGRVVQAGTQQRSDQQFADAIEFVRSGKLGKISVCRAWIVVNGHTVGRQKPKDPPKELDWDFWVGPAALEPYQENKGHWSWRWFFNTGGGWATDWGVHMIDIVLLGMRAGQPLEVSSAGGKIVADDDATTPDTMVSVLKYPNFVMTWELRQGNARGLDGGANHGSEFIGTNGTLIVDRGRCQIFPEGDRKLDAPPKVDLGGKYHFANFLECMRTRGKPRSDIESMHDTTVTCHLTNLSYLAGRSIRWDPAKEVVVGDEAAMRLGSYAREYRAPWKLPRY